MRWRSMGLAAAAVLAAVHVLGVLIAEPLWRFAELAAFVLLSVYAAGVARPRWLGPVALSPLLVDALLTIPRAGPPTYGWQVLSTRQPPHLVLDALDRGFRSAGPILLAVLVLLSAQPAWRPSRRLVAAAVLALAIVGYAAVRVGRIVSALHGHPGAGTRGVAVAAAVLVPGSLALAALALAGKAGRRPTAIGGVLIAAATLPMIDAAIGDVPMPYGVSRGDAGLFGWDAITPTLALPAPVPALTEALLLAGLLGAVAGLAERRGTGVRRSGG